MKKKIVAAEVILWVTALVAISNINWGGFFWCFSLMILGYLAFLAVDAKEKRKRTEAEKAKKKKDRVFQIGTSGNSAKINSTGEDAVIMCAGSRSKAKGKKGSWITLAEWVKDEEKGRYVPVCVKTERVDGEKIKEDTYYTLKNGEFVEVEE